MGHSGLSAGGRKAFFAMQAFFEKYGVNPAWLIYAGVAIVVLLLIWIVLRFALGSRVRGASGGRARQPRLGVVDAYDLDRQRQLVLVRRDNVEHLVMIGGPNDVLIESTIIRAGMAADARARQAQVTEEAATFAPAAQGLAPTPSFAASIPVTATMLAPAMVASSTASAAIVETPPPTLRPIMAPPPPPPAIPLQAPAAVQKPALMPKQKFEFPSLLRRTGPPPSVEAVKPPVAPVGPLVETARALVEPARPLGEPSRPAPVAAPATRQTVDPLKAVEDALKDMTDPPKAAASAVVAAPASVAAATGNSVVEKPAVEAPKPIVVASAPVIEPPKPVVVAPPPVVEAPKPVVETPKPVVEPPPPAKASDPLAALEEEMAKLLGRPSGPGAPRP